MTSAKKTASTATKKTAAKKAATKKAATKKSTVKKAAAKKAAATKSTTKSTAKKAAKKTTAKKAASAEKAVEKKASEKPKQVRTAQEDAELRDALNERLTELREEHSRVVAEMESAQRERLADSAGDDQGDSGSKTIEHEQEITVANTIAEKIYQVERALDRLDDGDWGICERCGKPIPAARLAVFPSATLCVACKQLDERR